MNTIKELERELKRVSEKSGADVHLKSFLEFLTKDINLKGYWLYSAGANGVILRKQDGKSCIKITSSLLEINIAFLQKEKKLGTLPNIGDIVTFQDFTYYSRPFYDSIGTDLRDEMAIHLDDIVDFFKDDNSITSRKKLVALIEFFPSSILSFFSKLKDDLKGAGINKWDYYGLPMNICKNGKSFVLVDF